MRGGNYPSAHIVFVAGRLRFESIRALSLTLVERMLIKTHVMPYFVPESLA
jgi:hypothetical protein